MKKITLLFAILLTAILVNAQTSHEYAVADVVQLNTDLKAGTYDIYILTESGGAYTFSTGSTSNNNALIKSTTIKAATGLVNKPILKLNSSTSGSTCNIIYTSTANLTINLEGLEFDGVNAGGTGQPLAFYSTAADTKLYVKNCYFHDFKNASGNGTIRWDGVPTNATAQIIDIQGSTFNACGGRIIYSNPASGATTINLKNNTFSNNLLLPATGSTRASIVYNNASNPGSISVDHCTFYNIITSGTDNIIRNPSGYGPMSFTNSIFSSVAQTLASTNTTISYCYLGGLATEPVGTNTFVKDTPAPAFTNAAGLDFSLTNKTSFICADASFAGNTSYYSVLPKLNTPSVGSASDVSTNGFTANWTAVANATGYDIKVYDGTSTLVNTTTATGQSTVSIPVTGLKRATTYTYKVVAKGDALSYNSSDPSAASSSFTTLGLPSPVASSATDITSGSLTANWTTVANATGYDVKLYLNTFLVSTTNVPGQASNTLSITGLKMGTTYNYTITAKGDGVTYLDSEPSAASAVAKTLAVTVNQINPDFSDGSWGTVSSTSIGLGAFPTYSANGYDLTKAYIQTTSVVGLKGENFAYMLKLDKTSNSGVLDLPTVASVSQLEIRASATTGRQFTLSIWNSGTSAWDLYGTYTTTVDTENLFLINFASPLTNAKFRIVDISSGAFSFYKIKSSVTQPAAVSAPTTGTASNVTSTGFTANWTANDANATGYKVFVYKATVLINTTTVSGQSSQNVVITGLQSDSTYTYKVSAIGDGDNLYSNSLLSGASAAVKTLTDIGTAIDNTKQLTKITVRGKSIISSEIGNFEVFDIQGAKLINVKETTTVITCLPKGLYIVRFTSHNNTTTTQKINLY